jgi:hypothetical protein
LAKEFKEKDLAKNIKSILTEEKEPSRQMHIISKTNVSG